MKKWLWIAGVVMLFFSGELLFSQEIRLVKQWHHQADFGGEISHCLLDKDNDLIVVHCPGISMINENKFTTFATWGQGPNEIDSIFAICDANGDLAVFEYYSEVTLFEKDARGYHEKSHKWLKTEPGSFYLRDAFFAQDCFFLAGLVIKERNKDKSIGALIRVYNDKLQKIEKDLITVQYTEPSYFEQIRKHFAVDGQRLYFMSQNELKLYQISLETITLDKNIELKPPDFYVPMPRSFFTYNKKYDNDRSLWSDLVTWYTSYSAATRMAILQGGYLVIQIRTCHPNMKKFALLFYNIRNNFSLDKIISQDDLLLAGKGDLLYCVHNGDPIIDLEANRVVIDLYQVSY
ncbi:MAG: hypothetical protein PHU81_06370 [Acidobacteriota bacterium]|nr:hypothetical protein [Acidobacteriota bacterium]